MGVTQGHLDRLESIAESGYDAFSDFLKPNIPFLKRQFAIAANDRYKIIDDILAEIEGDNSLAASVDQNNPLHTYKLQYAVAALSASHMAGGKTENPNHQEEYGELIRKIHGASSYESVIEEMSRFSDNYTLVLKVLDYVRKTYPKPTLAATSHD